MMHMTGDKPVYQWLLMLVLAVAVGARIYHLDALSLSADELANVALCGKGGFLQLIESVIATSSQPPLYPMLLCSITSFLGNADFIIRLPSALLGVLQVYLVYRIGRDFLSVEAGLLAAAWIAAAFQPIFFSQNAEYHLLLACLQLAVLWLFLSLTLNAEKMPVDVSAYALALWCATALLFYTGYSSLLFLLALLPGWFWFGRSSVLKTLPWLPYFWRSLLLVFLLWLPVLLGYRQWLASVLATPEAPVDVWNMLRVLLGPSAGRFEFFLWLAAFSVAGWLVGFRQRVFPAHFRQVLLCLLTFLLSGMVWMFFAHHADVPLFLLHQSLLVLLVSFGLTGLLPVFSSARARVPVLSVLVLAVLSLNVGENIDAKVYVHKRKPDFRGAVQVVQEEGVPDRRAAPVFLSHNFISHYLDQATIGSYTASGRFFDGLLKGQVAVNEFFFIEYSQNFIDPSESSSAIKALQGRYALRCLSRLRWIAVAGFVSGEAVNGNLREVPACAVPVVDEAA